MKRYLPGTGPPSDGLNGLCDGALSVLLVMLTVAVVIGACVVFPFVGLWRLVTDSRTKNRAA